MLEFEVDHSSFVDALSVMNNFAGRGTRHADSVLLKAAVGSVSCRATDHEMSASQSVPCLTLGEGEVAINVRNLLKVIRTFKSGILLVKTLSESELPPSSASTDLRGDDDDAVWISVASGRSELKMRGRSSDMFPSIPEVGDVKMVEVDARSLCAQIMRGLFAVSTDRTRVNVNGAEFLFVGDSVTMSSTDGHRLARNEGSIGPTMDMPERIIIPRSALEQLHRTLMQINAGRCMIGSNARDLFLQAGDLLLTVRLSDVRFPPLTDEYVDDLRNGAIPAGVRREDLLIALQQISTLALEREARIVMEFNGEHLILSGQSASVGTARIDVPIEYEGPLIRMAMNATYLAEALGTFDASRVRIDVPQKHGQPFVLTPLPEEVDSAADEPNTLPPTHGATTALPSEPRRQVVVIMPLRA